jgi:AcrR family transcriptional regulator
MAGRRQPSDEGAARPSLRREQVDGTRQAIVTSARRLFGERGYADASIDDIARDARVTKGAVYHHFESKKELFRAVYQDVETDAQQRTVAARRGKSTAVDVIVAGMHAYLDAALDREVQRITLIDGPAVLGFDLEQSPEEEAGHRALRDFIANAISSGSLVKVDPDMLTHLIRGSCLQAGLLIAHAPDPGRARKQIGAALEAMIRGLDARRAGPPARSTRRQSVPATPS